MSTFKAKNNVLLVLLLIITTISVGFHTFSYANSNGTAYWNFDEGTGASVSDSWGNNNGTIHGAQWTVDGKVNGALTFDGDDYVDIGGADITTPWTVGVWVKYDNGSTNSAAILGSSSSAIKVEQWDNTAQIGYTKYGIADYTFNYSMPTNVWTHLAFIGTTTGVKLYVNGEYKAVNSNVIDCPMGYIGIGKEKNCDSFIGTLDELKIYNRVLSAEEIAALAGVPYTPPNLLSTASKMFIEKGLQLQAWATTDDTNRYVLNPQDWEAIHFTAPTYYEAPMYNSDFHAARPNAQWSLAKAPYYNQLTGPPANNNHFLSTEQRANIDNLVSMCFGDEEGYSSTHVNNLKSWYDLSKSLYPDVLVHNNQWSGQWSETNLRYYMQTAKPDILSFDTYYFDQNESPGYEFIKHCANAINLYRKLALEGYDGTGESPIAFGQYLLGYKTGNAPYQAGNYRISESQLNLIPFTTVTMGGKWLNYFRWAQDKDFGLLYDSNGVKTDTFNHYAQMAKEIRNLGPHLVRLNSSNVYMVQGQHNQSGQSVTNPLPGNVPAWSSAADKYITNISVTNIGDVNGGLSGDVLVGYFNPLKGLTDEMKTGIFTSDNPEYFMITNGLVNNDGLASSEADKGACTNAQQRITLTMDLGARDPNTFKKVDRETGNVQSVALTHLSGTSYEFQFELGGGKGELFFWE